MAGGGHPDEIRIFRDLTNRQKSGRQIWGYSWISQLLPAHE